MGRIITVTSGKGGVGKTNICLNLALFLASKGFGTCLFDADLGLANINILLGLQPEMTLKDLILDNKGIEDILIRNYQGIDIFPGSTGVEELANLEPSRAQSLVQSLSKLGEYDYLLFDTSAGIAKNVLSFCLSTPEVVVVITPEPTSLTDAYSLVKVLLGNGYQGTLYVIVNQCKDMNAAKAAYGKFKGAVVKYLDTEILPLGVVFEDPKVVDAVKNQSPFFKEYPRCSASQCLKKIGERLISGAKDELPETDVQDFWRKCLSVIKDPLKLLPKKPAESKQEDRKETQGQKTQISAHTHEVPQSTKNQVSSGAHKEGKSSNTDSPSEPLGQDRISFLLEELVRGVSSVTEELRQLRLTAQGNGKKMGGTSDSKSKSLHDEKKPVVKVDIEEFLAKKGVKSKG